jgi:hypothetical protein
LDKQLTELSQQKATLFNAINTLQKLPTAMDAGAWGQLDPNQLIKDAIQGKSTTYRKARLLSDLTSADVLEASVMGLAKPGATPGEPADISVGNLQAGGAASSASGVEGYVPSKFAAPDVGASSPVSAEGWISDNETDTPRSPIRNINFQPDIDNVAAAIKDPRKIWGK